MRIVFDYNGHIQGLPRAGDAKSGRESVLVVRIAPEERRQSGQAAPVGVTSGSNQIEAVGPGSDTRWKTSDEALARDRAVRGHEAAHLSALGPYATSPAIFTTASAPDGQRLAVGGKIKVDMAEVPGDPEATLRKARVILNASQAPGDPSAADLRVAARAYALMQKARQELGDSRFA
jgi:hypothetical protein